MPKINIYQSRRDFFWAKQEDDETPEKHWIKLITLEKNVTLKTSNYLYHNSLQALPTRIFRRNYSVKKR